MALRVDSEILAAAQILWDYLKLGQAPVKSDCVIAMGSHDLRVAQHAADLVASRWALLLVCSGGLGRLTKNIWHESEAAKFARAARAAGIPDEQILIEDQSTNTSENLLFTKNLLEEKEILIHSAILVHKPYMERRAYAVCKRCWPELDFVVASPPILFKDYPTADIPMEALIQIMVGDFQRILVYPQSGFQIKQNVPEAAAGAYSFLVSRGYSRHLVVN